MGPEIFQGGLFLRCRKGVVNRISFISGIDASKTLGIEPVISAKEIADPEVDHLGVMAYAAWHQRNGVNVIIEHSYRCNSKNWQIQTGEIHALNTPASNESQYVR